MYFPFFKLYGWVKRSGAQPQTIDSVFPFRAGKSLPVSPSCRPVEQENRPSPWLEDGRNANFKGFYSPSRTALQAARTGLSTGTQVWLP